MKSELWPFLKDIKTGQLTLLLKGVCTILGCSTCCLSSSEVVGKGGLLGLLARMCSCLRNEELASLATQTKQNKTK